MNRFNLVFKSLGRSALLIEWPNRIDETILADIISFQLQIETEHEDLIVETVNTYNSLTLIFKSELTSSQDLESQAKKLYLSAVRRTMPPEKIWTIPVCYDEEFGIDLKEMATSKNCTIDEIISIHSAQVYTVYFTGFLPGFLYLGGLPEKLHQPRRQTPRLQIKKGAVAIGGQQTGIYPSSSPGGWNIIGNTPLNFFDPQHSPPCFAKAGDRLKFSSIDRNEYDDIMLDIISGKYEIECEEK